jgi:hypothetical protein
VFKALEVLPDRAVRQLDQALVNEGATHRGKDA